VYQEKADAPLLLHLQDATVMKQNRKRVLDGISLAIREGEQTAILGPNGSGKSSLIKLITRQHYAMVHPGGTPAMRIYGRERWNVVELRALLGIVSPDLQQMFTDGVFHGKTRGLDVVLSGFFASSGIYPHLEVSAEMRWRGAEALARMEVEHLASKPVDEMSTGEVRRLLIARALVHDPRALVLDEPTTGLDLLASHRFLETLRGIARQGKTIMLVTHHIEEILPEIERVILLKDGRVFLDGPKHEVLTTRHITALFEAPIQIAMGEAGYYSARVAGQLREPAQEASSL
jgi:iron complex transport system ATP-binding protein